MLRLLHGSWHASVQYCLRMHPCNAQERDLSLQYCLAMHPCNTVFACIHATRKSEICLGNMQRLEALLESGGLSVDGYGGGLRR
jgi:hypothetical protein